MAPTRTDFMPFDEFRSRIKMHMKEGWKPILPKQLVIINPTLYFDFDSFSASVAHELRHYIVYRSDGGVFARGLVRVSQDLSKIHGQLLDEKKPMGMKVQIAAALYRRSHAEPTSRFMMSIRFGRVVLPIDDENKYIASAQVTAQSEENLAARVLDWAEQASKDPKWAGDPQKRIGDWVKLAKRLGYPRFLELWHYNRGLVALYIQPQFASKRKEMTSGKQPPFDGHWNSEPWRIYPFKDIMQRCKRVQNVDDCHSHVVNQLALSQRDILAMLNDLYQQQVRGANLATNGVDPGNIKAFVDDLNKQLADINSLMETYTKYTQYKPGLWESY